MFQSSYWKSRVDFQKMQMHAIYFNNLELFLQEPKKAIALTYVSKSPTSFVEIKKSMTTLFSII